MRRRQLSAAESIGGTTGATSTVAVGIGEAPRADYIGGAVAVNGFTQILLPQDHIFLLTWVTCRASAIGGENLTRMLIGINHKSDGALDGRLVEDSTVVAANTPRLVGFFPGQQVIVPRDYMIWGAYVKNAGVQACNMRLLVDGLVVPRGALQV